MRVTLLLGLLFLPLLDYAQRRSRVVFVGVTADTGAWQSTAERYELFRDGLPLGPLEGGSVIIHDSSQVRGTYSTESGDLYIPELPEGLVVVSVGRRGLNPIPYPEFTALYGRSGHLRRQLYDAGYNDLSRLGKGFNTVSIVDPSSPEPSRSLQDTLFLNSRRQPVPAAAASRFSVAVRDTGGRFIIRDFLWPEGTLQREASCRSLHTVRLEGPGTEYYRSGLPAARGNYSGNLRHGLWTFYRDTPGNHIWYTAEYAHGNRSGRLICFYPNRKTKRVELWQSYTLATFPVAVGSGPVLVRERDSMLSGRCYDVAGKEIPHTPFEVVPKPPPLIGKTLSNTLQYPAEARDNGIQGRVVLQFVVTSRGEIRDAIVSRSVHPVLDAEALRYVKGIANWQPALRDDQPVDMTFTMPVTFKMD